MIARKGRAMPRQGYRYDLVPLQLWAQVPEVARVSDAEYARRLRQGTRCVCVPVWTPLPPRQRCAAAVKGETLSALRYLAPHEWRQCPFNAPLGWRFCRAHAK